MHLIFITTQCGRYNLNIHFIDKETEAGNVFKDQKLKCDRTGVCGKRRLQNEKAGFRTCFLTPTLY